MNPKLNDFCINSREIRNQMFISSITKTLQVKIVLIGHQIKHLLKKFVIEFFHNSHLIRRIQQNKVYKKLTDLAKD